MGKIKTLISELGFWRILYLILLILGFLGFLIGYIYIAPDQYNHYYENFFEDFFNEKYLFVVLKWLFITFFPIFEGLFIAFLFIFKILSIIKKNEGTIIGNFVFFISAIIINLLILGSYSIGSYSLWIKLDFIFPYHFFGDGIWTWLVVVFYVFIILLSFIIDYKLKRKLYQVILLFITILFTYWLIYSGLQNISIGF